MDRLTLDPAAESLLRELTPRVVGALARRSGDFDAAEDAFQEAMLAAANQWPRDGLPENPAAWLYTVATRRLHDQWRSNAARRERELGATPDLVVPDVPDSDEQEDDTLTLLYLCCHPSLTVSSQVALTLRAVGGLTTAQIARAFYSPEATMAQRISRAKETIRRSGLPFQMPGQADRAERLVAVLHVLYLIFNEGHATTSGPDLASVELSREAIRLTRMLTATIPDDGEAAGLLALMLLTDARRPGRIALDGSLVPLAEQDRGLWDQAMIAEGIGLISATLRRAKIGPYQLQATIAAVHAEATRAEETDWRQILALYGLLTRLAPSPTVTLNRSVALAMVHGPEAGLKLLETLNNTPLANHQRLLAVRAHLQEMAGDGGGARESYLAAAAVTTNQPEQRYLISRADAIQV